MFGGIAAAGEDRLVYATSLGGVLTIDTESGEAAGQFALAPCSPDDVHVSAVAVDADGTILLADARHHRVRRFDAQGRQLRRYGGQFTPGMTGQDDPGVVREPCAILPLADGILVGCGGLGVDHGVQRFTAGGEYVCSFPPVGEGWMRAQGLALVEDEIWVAETEAGRIRRFAPDGRHLGDVRLDGPGRPFRIAEDGYGRVLLLVAPESEEDQALLGVARIRASGTFTGWAVEAGEDDGRVYCPFDLAVMPDGRFVVADLPLGGPPDVRLQLFSADGRLLKTLMEDRVDLETMQGRWFESVLKRDDASARTLYEQARVHHHYKGASGEHLESARDLYAAAIEREPEFYLAHLGLGVLLSRRLAEPDAAENEFRAALGESGDDGDLLARIARCRHDRGDLDGAIRILQMAVEGENPPEAYHDRLEELGTYLLERAGHPSGPVI